MRVARDGSRCNKRGDLISTPPGPTAPDHRAVTQASNVFISSPIQVKTGKGLNTCSNMAIAKTTARWLIITHETVTNDQTNNEQIPGTNKYLTNNKQKGKHSDLVESDVTERNEVCYEC